MDALFESIVAEGVVADVLAARPDIGQPLHDMLRERLRSIAARNLLLERVVEEIGAASAKAGVTPVLLRGLRLDAAFSRVRGPRPAGDLDLLAPSTKRAETEALLDRLGFAPAEGRPWVLVRGEARVDLHASAADLFSVTGGDRSPYRFETDELLEEAEPAPWKGICILRREDAFLLAAVHAAAVHQFGRLRMLMDLAWMLRQWTNMDFGRIVERTGAWGMEHPVGCASRALRELLDLRLPEPLESASARMRFGMAGRVVQSSARNGGGAQGACLYALLAPLPVRYRLSALLSAVWPSERYVADATGASPPVSVWTRLRFVFCAALRAIRLLFEGR